MENPELIRLFIFIVYPLISVLFTDMFSFLKLSLLLKLLTRL